MTSFDEDEQVARPRGDANSGERWYDLPARCRLKIDPRKRKRILARIDALLAARTPKAG